MSCECIRRWPPRLVRSAGDAFMSTAGASRRLILSEAWSVSAHSAYTTSGSTASRTDHQSSLNTWPSVGTMGQKPPPQWVEHRWITVSSSSTVIVLGSITNATRRGRAVEVIVKTSRDRDSTVSCLRVPCYGVPELVRIRRCAVVKVCRLAPYGLPAPGDRILVAGRSAAQFFRFP